MTRSDDTAFADAVLDEAARQAAQNPSVRRADWQTATVTAVNADGTVDIGDIRARRLESYVSARVGDQVIISQSGMGNWIAIGRTASAASALGLPLPPRYKAAATDRTSTTTLADDPDLTMQLAASAVYVVEFGLFVGSGDGLIKTAWTVPSGATGLKGGHGPGSAATAAGADNISGRFGSHNFGTTLTYGRRDLFSNLLYAIESGTVITTTAGTLALAWAQSASNATPARMGLGSWMRVTRIS